jgi:hypothetical protein
MRLLRRLLPTTNLRLDTSSLLKTVRPFRSSPHRCGKGVAVLQDVKDVKEVQEVKDSLRGGRRAS